MNLALFDFDGTITRRDTFMGFTRYAVGRSLFLWGMLILSPVIMANILRSIPLWKTKEIFLTYHFKGWEKAEFDKVASEYSQNMIPQIVRPQALDRIEWHQAQGDEMVVVSASIDSWLKGWCDSYGLALVCSRLEVENGLITGKFHARDCIGSEKVRRIKEEYDLGQYETVFAYGDSPGDKEMLKLADVKYYRGKKLQG